MISLGISLKRIKRGRRQELKKQYYKDYVKRMRSTYKPFGNIHVKRVIQTSDQDTTIQTMTTNYDDHTNYDDEDHYYELSLIHI